MKGFAVAAAIKSLAKNVSGRIPLKYNVGSFHFGEWRDRRGHSASKNGTSVMEMEMEVANNSMAENSKVATGHLKQKDVVEGEKKKRKAIAKV
ncbi:hypothetical protein BGAL_0192g00050 [Botrytis galanthina]|uniref:Uncharacterized protein n=1 Tax=Botrytis galanthina TaxID=278940 RepID=A0A4S8QW40_9HELO|nr:hypothetical protein BGAL_0192g00050 [Botrytis galanthina]